MPRPNREPLSLEPEPSLIRSRRPVNRGRRFSSSEEDSDESATNSEYEIAPETSGSKPTPADIVAQFSPDVREFIAIPLDNFGACELFIRRNPLVLESDANELQRAARESLGHGFINQGWRIADRCLIVHSSQRHETKMDYLVKIRNSKSELVKHQFNRHSLVKVLTPIEEAATPPERTVEDAGEPPTSYSTNDRASARMESSEPYESWQSGNLHAKGIVSDFFQRGRVFKILWHQPEAEGCDGTSGFKSTQKVDQGRHRESFRPFMKCMLVVRSKKGYSICCPISTYGERGVTDTSETEIQAHAILYSSSKQPTRLRGEPRLKKSPIPVAMTRGHNDLSEACRIHFGKYYTVEWNADVQDVGMVPREYHRDILNNFLEEVHRD